MSSTIQTREQLPEVWISQVQAWHYRLPIWDLLATRGAGRYRLKVYAGLKNGKALGASQSRDYLYEWPEHKDHVHPFTLLPTLLEVERPAVLISLASPKVSSCWRLPRVCDRLNIQLIGWSKVTTLSRLRYIPNWILRRLKGQFYRRFSSLVVYGQSSRRELLTMGVKNNRIRVAQNTVDTGRDRAKLHALSNELLREKGLDHARIILVIGRMDQDKRPTDLLDVWPNLSQLDERLHLVYAGSGPLENLVRERAQSLPRVTVLGRVPEGHDYAWISAAEVNVQMGAVGLAINQSMALGTATVVADEFGPDSELIVHGETGWRFPRGDLNALESTLKEVITNDRSRSKVMVAAQKLLQEEVTIERMVDTFDEAISEALTRRRKE